MKKIRTDWADTQYGLVKFVRIMRLSLFLMLFIIAQGWAIESYSQKTVLNLNMSNVSVIDVLGEIENQTDFYFLFNYEQVKSDKKIDVRLNNSKIDETLNVVLEGTGLDYTIKDRQVIIKKAEQPGSNFSNVQQEKEVTGKVVDEDGFALPGVTVAVKGTTNGTVTDPDGNFSLNDVSANNTLVFSFIGLSTQEILVGEQTSFNITMEPDAIGIEEVVAIGYGTQRKATLTGATSSVKTNTIDEISTPALSNTLAGRAPGVTVINNSGLAGATSEIRIRGSFTDPLYVIDYIISSKSDFDALDPNEVEDISFLKDAAAASVYGMKAADGVVIVKTKSGGLNQKAKFTFKSSYSWQKTTIFSNDYTGYDEVIYRNDYHETIGREPYYTPEEIDYVKENDINYRLFDIIWQDPSQHQHTLTASGGSEKTSYFFMAGYHKSKGSFKNTNFQRANFRSNVTSQLTETLKLNVNVSANQKQTNRFFWPYDWDNGEGFTIADFYRSTFNVSRLWPWYVDENKNPVNHRTEYASNVVWGFHPAEVVFGGGYRDITYRTGNVIARLDWDLAKIAKGLSTAFMGSYTASDYFQKDLRLHQSFLRPALDPNNRILFDSTKEVSDWNVVGHNLSQSYENIYNGSSFGSSYQLNWFLNYDREFGDHEISAMTVYEQRGSKGRSMSGTANKLLTREVDQIFATSSDAKDRSFSGGEGESAYSSLVGRLNYSFADKYIAEFSFRYDGNYKFPKDTRWGFFPSVSAAWRISDEAFMEDTSVINNLKLRGSYGTSGNDWDRLISQEIAPFLYQNNYKSGNSYVFGNNLYNGIRPGTIPNPKITWAKTRMWNAGLDYGIFDNKITGTFDVFRRFNYDILDSRIRTIPTTWGGSAPRENYREDEIRGFEFSINHNNQIGEVTFDIGLNIGYAKDKVLLVDETEGLEEWRSAIGKPANRLGGYISKGIIRDQATLDALPEGFTQWGREPMLGMILFEDIRGANYSEGSDGKIDANDWTYLSDNGRPRINYGLTLNIEWKGLTINTLFQGVGAYDKMVATNNTRSGGVFQIGSWPYFGIWKDHWSPDRTDAPYPRAAGWGWIEAGYGPSTFWMKNGAYLRLRNLNVAYELPKSWLDFFGIQQFEVFFNATNLFTISDFKGIMDPEQETLDSYPVMKTLSTGISLTF